VIVLLNRYKNVKEKKDDEKKVQIKFSNSFLPWVNPVFQSLLEHSFSVQSLKNDKQFTINEESNLLKIVDTILSKKSTLTFVNQIESSLKLIFNCERVTLMMVHRFKKFSFRYYQDPNTGE
jgi:hypothetical protein